MLVGSLTYCYKTDLFQASIVSYQRRLIEQGYVSKNILRTVIVDKQTLKLRLKANAFSRRKQNFVRLQVSFMRICVVTNRLFSKFSIITLSYSLYNFIWIFECIFIIIIFIFSKFRQFLTLFISSFSNICNLCVLNSRPRHKSCSNHFQIIKQRNFSSSFISRLAFFWKSNKWKKWKWICIWKFI